MKTCHKFRDQIVAALYDELDEAQREVFESHLAACKKCAAAFAALQTTLSQIPRERSSARDAAFWESYWAQLQSRIAAVGARPAARPFAAAPPLPYRAWAGLAAAAALVLAGVFLGRTYFAPEPDAIVGAQIPEWGSVAANVALDERAQNYLERSKILVLGLINLDAADAANGAIDLRFHRNSSQQLVREARYLATQLTDPRQLRLRQLVEDLQLVLLQIANLEANYDLSAVDVIRSTVDRRGILLQINLEEMRRANADSLRSAKGDSGKQKSQI